MGNFNTIFYKSSININEIDNEQVDLIITSPPYFNIKDYSKNGYQDKNHSTKEKMDLGGIDDYKTYIKYLLKVWKECKKGLKTKWKVMYQCSFNTYVKKELNTHYNRHIFDLQSDIQNSILKHTKLFLLDLYIWNRIN